MSIFQKGNGGKWYYRFQLNGKEYYRACKGATNKKEAQQYEAIVKSELMKGNLGIIENKKRATLKEAVALYLDYSKNNKRSYKNDNAYTEEFKKFFKNKDLESILPALVEDFKKQLLDNGLKKATVNRYLQALSKLFNVAIDNKLIKENPMKNVKKLKQENRKIRVLSKDEEKRLFKALPKFYLPNPENGINGTFLKLIVKFALKTGARKSEILNIRWENIDFDYDCIELLHTKSGKKRKIPLAKSLKRILKKLKQCSTSEYVFTNPATQQPYKDIKRAFKTALNTAEVKTFRFHDLRHTFATRLIEKGVDIVVVMELLGHADIKTTLVYTHSDAERKTYAIKIIDNY